MKPLSKPMKDELWAEWTRSKKPGYTPRTYMVGHRARTREALVGRGLLRRTGRTRTSWHAFYSITAAGKKLAVEMFG